MKCIHGAAASAIALAVTASLSMAQESRYVDSATIRQVQQALHQRGASVTTDGLMGPGTEAAIKSFQQSQNLEPTGNLNRQTLAALGLERQGVERTPSPVYGAATIRQVQQTLNHRGFKAGPVSGMTGASLQAAVREFQRSENLEPSGDLNPRTLSALGIEAQPVDTASRAAPAAGADLREVQQALKRRGFLDGPVDGVMGPATERAIRQFQQSENLDDSGRLNGQTLSALGV